MADDTDKIPADIAEMSFEDALKELDQIVSKLEGGDVPLEESIKVYTRGTQLQRHCQDKLKSAEAKIEKLSLVSAGQPSGTEPLDGDGK